MDIERLIAEVSEALWAVYHERPDAPHLIWPAKRNDTMRISEQESKILITQWLERNGEFYSIETPTRQMYTQSGIAAMSARIDVTVYGSRDPAERLLNMELKSGTASLEAFRKDFEKLLREAVPGLWFHTLTNATEATWRSLEANMLKALERVLDLADAATHSVHFAFCVLEPPRLIEFDLDFSSDWHDQLSSRLAAALGSAVRPQWTPSATPKRVAAPSVAARTFQGGRRRQLVFMPTIEPGSFIHLSTRGESYALRSFGGARPRSRWVEADCKTTSELLARHPITYQVDLSGDGRNLAGEEKYWAARVAELNREYGVG